MSRVISDALQQIVRASQLGDVIVSNKTLSMLITPIFTVILNIDVATVSVPNLVSTFTNAVQNASHTESPSMTRAATFTSGVDATVEATSGTFPLEAAPDNALVTTPDQENLLSNTGSFPALESIPSFDVT